MFKTPPTKEWLEAHANDDTPEVIGPPPQNTLAPCPIKDAGEETELGKSEADVSADDASKQKEITMDSTTSLETWMDEARGLAAQCWCDPETEDRVMDVPLCEAVARRIAAWMETAAQAYRNEDFYRGIVVQIGEMFGDAAKTSNDGSIQQDVLALKVAPLVKRFLSERGVSSPATSVPASPDSMNAYHWTEETVLNIRSNSGDISDQQVIADRHNASLASLTAEIERLKQKPNRSVPEPGDLVP